MDNDNKKVKHKTLIMIQVVSMQAWIKNNPNAITSFDNIVALYTVYPELNKRFQNFKKLLLSIPNFTITF